MSLHEAVAELLEGGPGLVLGGRRSGQLLDEAPGGTGGDQGEVDVLELAPVEEPPDGSGVGAARVWIDDAGGEELVGCEDGMPAGALQGRVAGGGVDECRGNRRPGEPRLTRRLLGRSPSSPAGSTA